MILPVCKNFGFTYCSTFTVIMNLQNRKKKKSSLCIPFYPIRLKPLR